MAATVRIDVRPVTAWWRPLVQGVLCIPHLLLSGALTAVSVVLALLLVPVVLVLGRVPRRLLAIQVLTLRERVRCYTYFFLLRETCPPYALSPAMTDPGDDPLVTVSATAPASTPRWSAVSRMLVAAAHIAVLAPIGIVMDVCYPVWMLLAAANRGWPPALQRFLVLIERWVAAVVLYALFVTNEPPRFGLAAYADAHGDADLASSGHGAASDAGVGDDAVIA